jgi:hypothetical protein
VIFLVDANGRVIAVDARAIETASDWAIVSLWRSHAWLPMSEAWALARRRIRAKDFRL